MQHSRKGELVIIAEMAGSPVYPGGNGKRKQLYMVLLLVLFTSLKKEVAEAQVPRDKLAIPVEIGQDASRRTVRLAFRLAREKAKETGIFLSADSSALISPGPAARYRTAVYGQASQGFHVDFDGLEPDSKYFYKIFIRDRQNKVTWSEIAPIHTPGFNIRWSGGQKWLTSNNTTEIMLTGESVDPVPGNYQVYFRGKPGELLRITGAPDTTLSHFVIRLPRNAPPGRHRLVLLYKQKKIFEQDIDIL